MQGAVTAVLDALADLVDGWDLARTLLKPSRGLLAACQKSVLRIALAVPLASALLKITVNGAL